MGILHRILALSCDKKAYSQLRHSGPHDPLVYFFEIGSKTLICDFHREQAWERWLRKKENKVQNKDQVMSALRGLA